MANKLYIIGSIDENLYAAFTEQLTELEKVTGLNSYSIEVELLSEGGSAEIAMAFAERIAKSPKDICITAYGPISSAAVMILASGDYRRMAKSAWVMMHEDSGRVKGEVSQMEAYAARLRQLEDQWAMLLEKFTNTKASVWTRLHKTTTYITATQAKQYNLIDKVF